MSVYASISTVSGGRLDQVDARPLPADHLVYVQTVRDWFRVGKTAADLALTTDGITVVADTSGTAKFVRLLRADPFWQSIAFVVNGGTGNDENVGNSGSPLRTVAEMYRRLGVTALETTGRTSGQVATWNGTNLAWATIGSGTPMGAQFATIFVSRSGNDTTGDGSLTNPYLTIARADTAINSLGDASSSKPYKISAGPGLFNESFTLNPWRFIVGAGRNLTTISNPAANWLGSGFTGSVAGDFGAIGCAIGTNVVVNFALVANTGAGRFFLYDYLLLDTTYAITGNNSSNSFYTENGQSLQSPTFRTCSITNIDSHVGPCELGGTGLSITNTVAFTGVIVAKIGAVTSIRPITVTCSDLTNFLTVQVGWDTTLSSPIVVVGSGVVLNGRSRVFHQVLPDADTTLSFTTFSGPLPGGAVCLDTGVNLISVASTVTAIRTYTYGHDSNPTTRVTIHNQSPTFNAIIVLPAGTNPQSTWTIPPGGSLQSHRVAGIWEILSLYDFGGATITLAGDVTGPASANTVVGLTGAAGVVSAHMAALRWDAGVVNPVVFQSGAVSGNGQDFSILAQPGGPGNTNGGALVLASGASQGTGVNGAVVFRWGPTIVAQLTANPSFNGLLMSLPSILFDAQQTSPLIGQSVAGSGGGQTLTVKAQDAFQTGNTVGGGIIVSSGRGHGTGADGPVNFAWGTFGTAASFDPATNGLLMFVPTIAFQVNLASNITHQASTSGAGRAMTIQAQGAAAGNLFGGALILSSGARTGSGSHGDVVFAFGGGAVARFSVGNSGLLMSLPNILFDGAQVTPVIGQAASIGSTGTTLTIKAQDASALGGAMIFLTGAGSNPGAFTWSFGGGPFINAFISSGVLNFTFSDTIAPTFNQIPLSSGTGKTLSFIAQSTSAGQGGSIAMRTGVGTIIGSPASGFWSLFMGTNTNPTLGIDQACVWEIFSGVGATGSPTVSGQITSNNDYSVIWDQLVTNPKPDVGAGAPLLGGLRVDINGDQGFIPIYAYIP